MEFLNRAASAALAACATLVLAACGGGGDGGSTGSGGGGSGGGSSSPFVLFASDAAGDLAAFSTLSPSAGTTLTGHVVETVPSTGMTMAYDAARDELYTVYSNPFTSPAVKLEIYAHASTLVAGAAPARTVVLSDLSTVYKVVLDTVNDRLWFSGADINSSVTVAVVDHASTLSGTVAVSRMLRTAATDIAVDPVRDILYTNPVRGGVAVFLHASTLNGDVQADHALRGLGNNDALALDATRDILYGIDNGGADISVARDASTATLATSVTISLPAGASLQSLAVDAAHDRLYAGARDGAYVIDSVSTRATGSAPAALVQATGALVTSFAFAGQ